MRALCGQLAGDPLVFDGAEALTGVGNPVHTEHLDRNRRAGLVEDIALVVVHGAHLAERLSDQQHVAHAHCPALDEQRADRAATRVEA